MNNQVTLVGAISSEFTKDHEMYGENYYRVTITVTRDSGTDDKIPVIVSDRLINLGDYHMGNFVIVRGQYRSYNLHEENKTRLVLFVFATEWESLGYVDYFNDVFLEGYITKPPVYRKTPLGREITDVMLAVIRGYGKTDYIPCVSWGRNAKFISKCSVGDPLRLSGRVQSRTYQKDGETMTAYEVSVRLIELNLEMLINKFLTLSLFCISLIRIVKSSTLSCSLVRSIGTS